MAKANYEKPASQVDLEARLANGNQSDRVLSTSDEYAARQVADEDGRTYQVKGNETDAYVGVNPEYQTYANDTEKPFRAESGPEAQLEELLLDATDEGDEDDDEEEEPSPSTATTQGSTSGTTVSSNG